MIAALAASPVVAQPQGFSRSAPPPVTTPSDDSTADSALSDPDGAGLLGPQNGGLGPRLWQGASRADVLRLLLELPTAMPSPAGRALMRRLLLSDADAPQPAPGEPPPSRGFGALRVAALAALGDPRGARDLAAKLPNALADEATARALIDAQLLHGALDCPWANTLGKPFSSLFWRHLALFCQLHDQDQNGARRALDRLGAESGGLDDPSPLLLAMMRRAGAPMPGDVTTLDPARLAMVARLRTDAVTHLTATERAATALYLDAKTLQDAYQTAPATDEEQYRLKDLAARERGPRVRGLVQQAFSGAMGGKRRLMLASLALDLLDPPMWVGPPGATVAAMLDTLTVNAEAAALAPNAVRLYEAQGRPDQARRWRDLAARTNAKARLWPLVVVYTPTAPGLSQWLNDALKDADSATEERVAGALFLLEELGAEIPNAALKRVDAEPTALPGDPQRWSRLDEAAKEGRVGETLLLALVLIGEAGPADAPPAALAPIVRALRRIGLDGEARALAREAIAAQGL